LVTSLSLIEQVSSNLQYLNSFLDLLLTLFIYSKAFKKRQIDFYCGDARDSMTIDAWSFLSRSTADVALSKCRFHEAAVSLVSSLFSI